MREGLLLTVFHLRRARFRDRLIRFISRSPSHEGRRLPWWHCRASRRVASYATICAHLRCSTKSRRAVLHELLSGVSSRTCVPAGSPVTESLIRHPGAAESLVRAALGK
jgi:hypothetical protein